MNNISIGRTRDDSRLPQDDSGLQKIQKKEPSRTIEQLPVNLTVSILKKMHIDNSQKLHSQFDKVFKKITADHRIINKKMSQEKCDKILNQAIKAFNKQSDTGIIRLRSEDQKKFHDLLVKWQKEDSEGYSVKKQKPALEAVPLDASDPFTSIEDDLDRVTTSYDRLATARNRLEETQTKLIDVISKEKHVVCPTVIIGAGDAATTVWVENHQSSHGKVSKSLEAGKMPPVFMLGETFGNWGQENYVLAQNQSFLDRGPGKSNPSDFMAAGEYRKNPYVNARHLYQSNLMNLAKTDAPLLLGIRVTEIAKKENHLENWEHDASPYRVTFKLPDDTTRTVYTERIDFAAGLGTARNIFPGSYIDPDLYQQLSNFDEELGYTPITDSNVLILGEKENLRRKPRRIFIYGGGANGAAAYRKCFFGDDRFLRPFKKEARKNKMLWLAKGGPESSGYGKVAKTAILVSEKNNELCCGELIGIKKDSETGEILVQFTLGKGTYEGREIHNKKDLEKVEGSDPPVFQYRCDQFVQAVGQDPAGIRSMVKELDPDLRLLKSGEIPVGLETSDGRVRLTGGAAMAIGYNPITKKDRFNPAFHAWLKQEKVALDAQYGVMPGAREGVKALKSKEKSIPISEVNINITDSRIIIEFLKSTGVRAYKIKPFVKSLLAHRRETSEGISRVKLQDLIKKFGIDDRVVVKGHSYLVKKK